MDKKMTIPRDWSFDNTSVADNFDNHVREQLPWYDLVTKAVGLIVRHYAQHNGTIYDIGCSTGNMDRELSDIIAHRQIKLLGVDNSPAMRERYEGKGQFILSDAVDVEYKSFDVAICFLVMQFIPIPRRRILIEKLLKSLKSDGAIIIVDKYALDDESPYFQTIKRRLTLMGKVISQTPSDDIIAKELSLSGVQRPLSPRTLFYGLKTNEFFRFGEFAGWVIEGQEDR